MVRDSETGDDRRIKGVAAEQQDNPSFEGFIDPEDEARLLSQSPQRRDDMDLPRLSEAAQRWISQQPLLRNLRGVACPTCHVRK